MLKSIKPAIWVVAVSCLAITVIISGAQAAQSRTASSPGLADSTPTFPHPFRIVLTDTPTTTLTSTPTATLTSTPTPTASPTSTPTSTPTPLDIVIEEPAITPAYAGMCASYWYSYTNDRGYDAYLTLNVNDPSDSANSGEWRPTISQPGYYRIEAYIPYHPPIAWECPTKNISSDTSDAHYVIHHANGQTIITGTQRSYSSEWLPLGEHLFNLGSNGYVVLTDLNDEETLTTTVSFSALRFSWTSPPPESVYLPLVRKLDTNVITSTVGIQNAPALDQCHLPTTSRMQTWWNHSPYRLTNVYIGGGLLYSECTVPDAGWIETIRNQGWGMIPTWVGPQAPCSDFRLRMSSDPAVSYQEGQAEADAALLVAQSIGLTASGMGGTIIYYDMEGYSYGNQACRNAVKSFISGWTERLHYWGNKAGAYGGACTTYVSDWATITYPPDDLWVAAVNYKHYTKNVPLFGITCLNDNLWPNHQRIRQYAAAHNETWGNVTFNIDSNIADAEVVTQTNALTSLVTPSFPSINTTEVTDYVIFPDSNRESWLIANGSLYRSDPKHLDWQLISNLPPNMAIRNLDIHDRGIGWLIATSNEDRFVVLSTLDGGESWSELSPIPMEPGWYPASIQFTSAQNGWIAIKKQTRSIFSVGRLLRTYDGGHSWQTLDLPIGEAVRFISNDVGWVAGGVSGNELYQTLDGGSTWEPVMLQLPKNAKVTISLPAFSTAENGILPVAVLLLDKISLNVYTTHDSGKTWQLTDSSTHLPEGFFSVNFSTPLLGWGVTYVGACQANNTVKNCVMKTRLWRTRDGGNFWELIELP